MNDNLNWFKKDSPFIIWETKLNSLNTRYLISPFTKEEERKEGIYWNVVAIRNGKSENLKGAKTVEEGKKIAEEDYRGFVVE